MLAASFALNAAEKLVPLVFGSSSGIRYQGKIGGPSFLAKTLTPKSYFRKPPAQSVDRNTNYEN